jgi:cell division initiation protein
VSKNKQLEQEVAHLKDKLSHFEKIQEGMHETLQIAKQSADKEVNAATAEARSRISKAELEAEKIINTARAERQEVRQGIMRMLEKREEIVNGIRHFLEFTNESLNKFSGETDRFKLIDEQISSNFSPPQQEHKPLDNAKVPEAFNHSFNSSMEDLSKTENVDRIIDELD